MVKAEELNGKYFDVAIIGGGLGGQTAIGNEPLLADKGTTAGDGCQCDIWQQGADQYQSQAYAKKSFHFRETFLSL